MEWQFLNNRMAKITGHERIKKTYGGWLYYGEIQMKFTLTATDVMASVLQSMTPETGVTQKQSYSAYGETVQSANDVQIPGFNGERRDPLTGTTHLGNGYRAYNPTLMRFHAPDSMSPFGAGGLNCYAYCSGDPINRSDPSGHMSAQAGVGIGLGVLGLALGAASFGVSIAAKVAVVASVAAISTGIASIATENSNPEASAALGWVSMSLGIAGTISSFSGMPTSSNMADDTLTELGHTVFSHDQHARPNLNPKDTSGNGFTDNYRGKGESALRLHGGYDEYEGGQLFYEKGVNYYNSDGVLQKSAPIKTSGTIDSVVSAVHSHEGIDLGADKKPLHLLACYSSKGGNRSAAQKLANATQRTVYSYSRNPIKAPPIWALEKSSSYVHARSNVPLIKFRNIFRGKGLSDQLVKTAFYPQIT